MVSPARSTSTRQAVGRTQTEPKADCEPGVGRVRAAARGFCRALSLASPPVRFSTETAALLALIGFAVGAFGTLIGAGGGFILTPILLLLYLLIVWRALKIVAGARDLYCAIVAGGIAFMFLFQVFVNSAMTMGIAPITGIPLPFLSVGGSSMVTNFLAIGILQAIHARSVVPRKPRSRRR